MQVLSTDIADVKILIPDKFEDPRGYLSETWSVRGLEAAGIGCGFVQENHTLSNAAGTVRGLHYQIPPVAQDKLVRVLRGRMLDVAVDIRRDSPTFGRPVCVELSSENRRQVFVPVGFAHGFVTREANTEVLYKMSGYYSTEHERGILWNDPALGIEWGISEAKAVVNVRDAGFPRLSEAVDLFGC